MNDLILIYISSPLRLVTCVFVCVLLSFISEAVAFLIYCHSVFFKTDVEALDTWNGAGAHFCNVFYLGGDFFLFS